MALQQISQYVGKIPYLELVKECSGPTEAMEFLASESVDAIFTDIEMPDVNGLEYIRSLKERPIIVFVTAYPNFAVEGFQVDATDYLLKPFSLMDFMKSAEKVKYQYELRKAAQASQGGAAATANASKNQGDSELDGEYIFVRAESRTVRLKISEIQYVESHKEYVVIFSDKSMPVMTLFSMKAMEERLPKDIFMRVHRSFIVNLTKIMAVNQNRIVLDKDVNIPIGDQYRDAFQSFLTKHFWK